MSPSNPAALPAVIHEELHCRCGWGLILEGPDKSPQRERMARMADRFRGEHRRPGCQVFESREEALAAREGVGC